MWAKFRDVCLEFPPWESGVPGTGHTKRIGDKDPCSCDASSYRNTGHKDLCLLY